MYNAEGELFAYLDTESSTELRAYVEPHLESVLNGEHVTTPAEPVSYTHLLQRTSAPGGKPKRADGSGTQACAPAGKRCPAQKRRPFPQTHPPVSEGSYGKEMAGDGAGCAGDAHPGDATQKQMCIRDRYYTE